ncbi:uncharacterized protein DFL_008068 [Arthrobotrys flagrans]|uniref:Uncharacterized protein n=1 Tax=Arthrobotrys flagrans TaxID=97331 RepID=A0A436ZMU3_ARTFL|nr:hypothetical protein DFL_008068 [Arthrobotrys flagrans]
MQKIEAMWWAGENNLDVFEDDMMDDTNDEIDVTLSATEAPNATRGIERYDVVIRIGPISTFWNILFLTNGGKESGNRTMKLRLYGR